MNILDALKQITVSIKQWTDENKVQKISGKGLSTHDYTTIEKNKVASIPNNLVIIDNKLYLAQDGVTINDSAVTLPNNGTSEFEGEIIFDCGSVPNVDIDISSSTTNSN